MWIENVPLKSKLLHKKINKEWKKSSELPKNRLFCAPKKVEKFVLIISSLITLSLLMKPFDSNFHNYHHDEYCEIPLSVLELFEYSQNDEGSHITFLPTFIFPKHFFCVCNLKMFLSVSFRTKRKSIWPLGSGFGVISRSNIRLHCPIAINRHSRLNIGPWFSRGSDHWCWEESVWRDSLDRSKASGKPQNAE